MTLFRKEVMEQRGAKLHGDISLAMPLPWHIIGYLLLVAVAAATVFLALASYSRVETVSGAVVLDRGVAAIMPSRPGIIAALHVRENQHVSAGARLADIRAEEMLASGNSAPAGILEALERQEAGLARQAQQELNAAGAEQARLSSQIRGFSEEVASLDRQIAVQRELVASALNEVKLVEDISRRGFISRRDVLARQETLLTRRQQLAQIEQIRGAKAAQLAEAHRTVSQIQARAEAQAASLSSGRAQVAQRRVEAQSGAGYVITAPVAGRVTAMTARPGQAVATQQALMVIVPDRALPRAELYVPTRAAGFLEAGQEVRLAVDAFPFQRFGTVNARIAEISAVAVPRQDDRGTTVPVYLVTAELSQPWVTAFDKRQPLLPGMTLSARIVTERQSLLEWLFQPLFSVGRR